MAEQSLKDKTVKGVAWSGIDNVVQYGVTFVVSIVLARLLSPDDYGLIGIIYQTMYGFTSLFAPTSLILMVSLTYLDVSYGSWLKNIWKLLLELFIIFLIIFIILALL